MKKFTTKNKLGFSLLELMVVVAIIGVLATFAVPRFNIFRARARQGEAKSNLGVIFTLQEAFKIDKEKYYDGTNGTWGGFKMDPSNRVGYTTGVSNKCEANKLGFRLANCDAARYGYYMVGATEDGFLAYAVAPSDTTEKRIFPGCPGISPESTKPSTSKTGGTDCDTSGASDAAASPATGDAFCLDHKRTVDNFMDIVGAADCND